jgi:hypothetical protein
VIKFTTKLERIKYIKIVIIKINASDLYKGRIRMKEEGSLARGMVFGLILSIPLWISILGWIKLL